MEDKQNLHLYKLQERDRFVEALYQKLPELKEVDEQIRSVGLSFVRATVKGNRNEGEGFAQEIEALSERQKELLASMGLDESVYDPKWDCPRCEDKGFIQPNVLCSCRAQKKANHLLKASRMPDKLQKMTFANFSADPYKDPKDMAKKIKRCQNFASELIAGTDMGNLVLRGDVGRGKTHLAAAIANELLQSGKTVLYGSAEALMDLMRSLKYDEAIKEKQNEMLALFYTSSLLVIDDLGSENLTDFVVNQWQIIIEERNLRNKSWIITTNLMPTEIDSKYGKRLSDRIFEKASIFKLESPQSMRLTEKQHDIKMV